jgi:RsiW-degrading membrane proteinase PrsW (M82 family)
MDIRANLAIAVAPALLLLWLFKKWDEKRPEPPGAVRNVVILGAVICIPAAAIEIGMTMLIGKDVVEAQGQLLNAFLIAATTEEALKLAIVLIFLWRKPHFDEVMDGILYTAAASLGFALLENILYSAGNPLTGMIRAFTAVPLHATCSGIMGYFVGRGKMSKGTAIPWVIGGLFIAIFIHGLYDWIAMSGGGFGEFEPNLLITFGGILAIVAVCAVILRLMVKHALAMDDALLGPASRPLQPATQQAWPAAPQAYPQPGYVSQPGYPPNVYPQPGYVSQPGYPPPQQYPQQQYPQYGQPQYPPTQPAYPQPPQYPGAPPPPGGWNNNGQGGQGQ